MPSIIHDNNIIIIIHLHLHKQTTSQQQILPYSLLIRINIIMHSARRYMHSARRYYQQRHRHHRRCGEDSSSSDSDHDNDSDSNNASSGSEGVEEYLSPSSSSSPSSTASVDKELALEMPSFPDSSVESDKEEYVEEGRFSPSSSSSESGDEEKFRDAWNPRSFSRDEQSDDLISASSSSENSDSDYDSSCDIKEIHPCNAFGNNIKSHSRFVFKAQGEETPDSTPPSLHNADTPTTNPNCPLSPWKKSCTSFTVQLFSR